MEYEKGKTKSPFNRIRSEIVADFFAGQGLSLKPSFLGPGPKIFVITIILIGEIFVLQIMDIRKYTSRHNLGLGME